MLIFPIDFILRNFSFGVNNVQRKLSISVFILRLLVFLIIVLHSFEMLLFESIAFSLYSLLFFTDALTMPYGECDSSIVNLIASCFKLILSLILIASNFYSDFENINKFFCLLVCAPLLAFLVTSASQTGHRRRMLNPYLIEDPISCIDQLE